LQDLKYYEDDNSEYENGIFDRKIFQLSSDFMTSFVDFVECCTLVQMICVDRIHRILSVEGIAQTTYVRDNDFQSNIRFCELARTSNGLRLCSLPVIFDESAS